MAVAYLWNLDSQVSARPLLRQSAGLDFRAGCSAVLYHQAAAAAAAEQDRLSGRGLYPAGTQVPTLTPLFLIGTAHFSISLRRNFMKYWGPYAQAESRFPR